MEHPLDYERRVVRWLDSIADDCEELFLLGDIIDYWFEFAHVVPKGFVRFLGKLAELSDRGIRIHWFTGNHDIWAFGYLTDEVGCTMHYGPEVMTRHGKRLFLAHGDRLGHDTLGERIMFGIFHNKVCQWLFKWVHPDLTTGFAHWWSKKSRLGGDDMPDYLGEDKEYLVKFAKQYVAEHTDSPVDYLVFGHRHIELDLMLNRQQRMFILGDWIHHFSYAVLDHDGRMWMENFEADLEEAEPMRQGVSIAF